MSLDAGRCELYAALKTLHSRWDTTDPHWQDAMKAKFVEQVLTPLNDNVMGALQAIDQMAVVLNRMHRDCEGSHFDIHGSSSSDDDGE